MRGTFAIRWALTGWLAVSAGAAEIWTDVGGVITKFDSNAPGTLIPVGSTGAPLSMDGLDFTSAGVLYGVMDRSLFRINQETGWATPIGGQMLDPNTGAIFFDLSWDPSTSTMYGIAARGGSSPQLYAIDLDTATATFVGTIDYSDFLPPGGLATTRTGVRYIDDGYGRRIRRLGTPDEGWVPTYPLPHEEGFLNAFFGGMTIDWSRDEVCYHATINLDVLPNGRTQLWTVNLTTGVGTYVGDIGDPSTILLTAAIKPVPEPAALLVALMLAGCARARRGF